MFPFTPSYLKHGRQFIKDARKLVAYKRDLVSEDAVSDVEREIAHLEHAVAGRKIEEVSSQMKRLDDACGKLTQPSPDASWRENVEVFLVAIVIALAVRTYFLQPFTIPTGSMQPTLNGIIATPNVEPPNAALQALNKVLYWRTYLNVVAQEDGETLVSCKSTKEYVLFDATQLDTNKHTYIISATPDVLTKAFDLPPGKTFKRGEPILQGYIDTGDHVFVDKFSYHFVRPHRDQVFVFSTRDIEKLNPMGPNGRPPSQYYIKRLAGLPNDDLRIDSPKLYINGKLAEGEGYAKVMAGDAQHPVNGYRGYGQGMYLWPYLVKPDDHFTLEEKKYFALGDNSYNSLDSRNWGPVPQQNIAGRALFVYYPFASHFGRIH